MPDWIRSTALGDLVGEDFSALSHQALYRNRDQLQEKRGAIEAALRAGERDLFDLDATVCPYDLTSTYFEGDVPLNGKAKRGYSRDKRPDLPRRAGGSACRAASSPPSKPGPGKPTPHSD